MTESEFNQQVDETLLAIEEAIDQSGADIDYENVAGILTLNCPDDSQVIINRQTPARQLWVAARDGGYHFDFDSDRGWILDRDGTPLFTLLSRLLSAQCGEPVTLEEAESGGGPSADSPC